MPPVDPRSLRRLLADDPFVRDVVVLETTRSTNDDALRLLDSGAPEGTVVVASCQTAGRGRLARRWHSAADVGLYVSVLLRPVGPIESLTRWTVASALAACAACRACSGAAIEIKWPNDLMFEGRKVAGTLAELRSSGGVATGLVVGTGFNVNHQPGDFPPDLREHAVSLRTAGGGELVSRESLAAHYVKRLGAVADLLARDGWIEVARAWLALAPAALGRRVLVVPEPGGAQLAGTTAGLDRDGALLVERFDGSLLRVRTSGSVSDQEGG